MFGQRLGTRGAVAHRHDRHAHVVQIPSGGRDLEAVRPVAIVGPAGIDDLDGRGFQHLGEMPLDIRRALVLLHVGHPALRPDVFADVFRPRLIRCKTLRQRNFRSDGAQIAHLSHELDAPLQAKGSMALARVQMHLGRNPPLAEFPVHERGARRGVRVDLPVVQAHRAGLFVEFEHVGQPHVRAVALTGGRGAGLAVRGGVGGRIDNRPVDIAREVIDRVDPLIRRRLAARCQQERQVRPGRHGDHTDFFRVEAPLGGLFPHKADRPLAVFPGGLPDGQSHGPGRPVHEVDALHAQFRKPFPPLFNQPHVAAVHITAAGDEDHAGAVRVRRFLEPLEIGDAVLVGVEIRKTGLVGHGCDLVRLRIGHLALGPDGHAFLGQQGSCQQEGDQGEGSFHGATGLSS